MPLDLSQPYEAVEEPKAPGGFDPSKPFEEITPHNETNWPALFGGVDYARNTMQPDDRAAFSRLASLNDNSADIQKQAVNQAYISKLVPDMSHEQLQQNWPAVRQGFAKSALGINDEVNDSTLYEAINKRVNTDLKGKWSGASTFDRLKMMFGSHGYGDTPVEGAIPAIGSEAAGTKGGAFTIPKMEGTGTTVGLINASNKFISALTTPENAAIMVGTGGAGALAEIVPLTRAALVLKTTQAAGLGTFTVIGAKDTINAAAEAKIVFNDPKATNAEKADAIATTVLSGAMTIAAAKGTYDFAGTAKAEGQAIDANKARMESVAHLREEAARAEPKTAETLNQVADEIESLAPVVEPKPEAKAGEATVEDLDGGGFVVTDKDGNRVYSQDRAEADQLAKELGAKAEVKGNDRAEYDRLQKEMADMGYDKAGTPEFNRVWQEAEDIKNRNEGMPPEQKAAEPAKSAPDPKVLEEAGIKNSYIDQELTRLGKEPGEHGVASTTDTAEFQKAKELMDGDPLAGKELVEKITENPKPLTVTEGALLTREMVRTRGKREAAHAEVLEAAKSGDAERLEKARAEAVKTQAEYDKTMAVSDLTGKMQAQSFRIRQRMLKEDYSLAAMERGASAENSGQALPEAVRQEIADLHERLAANEKAAEERNKVVQFPKQGKVAKTLSERAEVARARISERLLKASGESFVEGEKSGILSKEMLDDLGTVGADLIARGAKEIGKWSEAMVKEFGEAIKPHLKAIFDKAREVKSEETRLASAKTRMENRNADLRERIENNDVSPKEKTQPLHLDEEANRIQAEGDMLRLEYDRLKERIRHENLTPLQKVGENALVGWDSTRAILAGFEFSAVARQGAFRLFSHPIETIKTMGDAFKALVSNEEGAHAINLKTLNDPAAAEARMNKLALVDEKSKLSKQEEIYMGKLVGKIPGVKNFEQFAHVFLNKVRLDMWKEFRGDFPDASPRLIADFINAATGRGALGTLERISVQLNRGLFSPRFMASRIQMGSGYYIWKAALKGDPGAVKAISRNYARTLLGYGVFMSALYAGFKAYSSEDVSISFDPKSSDFMKLKVGKTRIDLAAGVQQPLVFLSRLATQEKTLGNGKTVSIQKTSGDELLRFGRSKLNPSAGKAVDFYTGTNMVGEPATLSDLFYPATYKDIKDEFAAHDVPEATLIAILAMFGVGVNTYDSSQKRSKPIAPRK